MGRTENMKIFAIFAIFVSAEEGGCDEPCYKRMGSGEENECRDWAAFMPGYYWTFQKSTHFCYLKKKTGWKKVSDDDWVYGAHGEQTGITNINLVGGDCMGCGPWDCHEVIPDEKSTFDNIEE